MLCPDESGLTDLQHRPQDYKQIVVHPEICSLAYLLIYNLLLICSRETKRKTDPQEKGFACFLISQTTANLNREPCSANLET